MRWGLNFLNTRAASIEIDEFRDCLKLLVICIQCRHVCYNRPWTIGDRRVNYSTVSLSRIKHLALRTKRLYRGSL